MNKTLKTLLLALSCLSALLVFSTSTQAHNTYGKRVDDFNITLEIIQTALLQEDGTMREDTSHSDAMTKSLSVGRFELNVYLLNPQFQPVADGQIELVLTKDGTASPAIELLSQGNGKYGALWEITEPGKWNFQVTARAAEAQRPLIATYTEIEILSTALASGNSTQPTGSSTTPASSTSPTGTFWGINTTYIAIGAGVVILAVVLVIFFGRRPAKKKKGA